ncbi:MAG: hypothetical protein LUO93_00680 [Methanomicrobiales archaeon]|nr:hypothetical protein [Methanomicrobiales archaeon]
MKISVYYHASKESLRDAGMDAGLSGEALDFFCYAGEICVELEVGVDGSATPVAVDGRELEDAC